jgi:predicted  nucleic acid-binding Zn-ribbon protein
MLNRKVEALEATVAELRGQLKEQAAQIQKVSAQLEVNKPAAKVVVNKP